MAIVINKSDSLLSIRQKLKKAETQMQESIKQEIQSLCGVLKNTEKNNPVQIIRKMRDEEWD